MSLRGEAAEVLERMAFAIDVLEPEGWNAKEFAGAAWAIRNFEGEFEASIRENRRVDGLHGEPLRFVQHLSQGAEVEPLVALESQIPRGLFDLATIDGIGPKKVRAVWKILGITNLEELEHAARTRKLLELKGFGEKTQAKILASIEERRRFAGMLRLDQAKDAFRDLSALFGSEVELHLAGEARRGCPEIAKLVLVASGLSTSDAVRVLASSPHFVLAPSGAGLDRICGHWRTFQFELWPVEPESLVQTLFRVTGSEEHVREVLGVLANPISEPQTEEDLYASRGFEFQEPELRESSQSLVPKGYQRRRLVTRKDLRGAIHNHTIASDGSGTLEEMRAAAITQRLDYLAITDRSQSAFYARGLVVEKLRTQMNAIRVLNLDELGSKCRIFSGVESDILEDGSLDYEDSVLRDLEVVVASVHNRFGHGREQITQRLVKAALHGSTAVIGHPTGRRLLGVRKASEIDYEVFLAACRQAGVAVELNASRDRMDLDERALAMAKSHGVLVSIAADAHSPEELESLELGVCLARRAGLSPDDVLNTKDVTELCFWLTERRRRFEEIKS